MSSRSALCLWVSNNLCNDWNQIRLKWFSFCSIAVLTHTKDSLKDTARCSYLTDCDVINFFNIYLILSLIVVHFYCTFFSHSLVNLFIRSLTHSFIAWSHNCSIYFRLTYFISVSNLLLTRSVWGHIVLNAFACVTPGAIGTGGAIKSTLFHCSFTFVCSRIQALHLTTDAAISGSTLQVIIDNW